MIRRALVLSCVVLVFLGPSARAAGEPAHVVIVTIPAFSWDVYSRAPHPQLQKLIDTGAVAAVATRSVTKGSTPVRGYLTLGAGNRAYALTEQKPRRDENAGQVALRASDRFENGTAAEAMSRRVLRPRTGAIVVPDVPALDADQSALSYGTRVGALGEALDRGGAKRAVVIAGDLSSSTMRRSAALAIADYSGTVDSGDVDGLLRPVADAAYGVETDPARFTDAVRRALKTARVVVVDPGETLRADEFALDASDREADAQKTAAMWRTDSLIGRVAALITPRDTLYVVGVSSPLDDVHDHLTLAVAHGAGIARGWLTSPTTHRPGIVTLTDFAPTVLSSLDIRIPSSMGGTSISVVPSNAPDRVARLAALDVQTGFGDRFQGVAAKLVVALLAAIAVALAVRRRRLASWLALAVLAVPPLAYVDRLLPVSRLGIVGATAVTVAMVAVVATVLDRLPIAAWKAGLVLVGLAFAITTGDLLAGAPLQVNNVFGYSPISAGRFYGNSNIAFSILIATTLIGVFGLLELTRAPRMRVWSAAVLVAVVVVQGLPQFGADFGGVAASVPAMLVAYAVARGRGVRIWRLGAWAAAGAAAAVGVTLLDLARPPQARTHLGRFAADLFSGHAGDILTRKIQSNIGLLGSVWTLTVPIALVVAVLIWRARPTAHHHMLIAGLAGTLVAGVIGFAVNDTGIWVLGMVLAYVVPMAVLLEGPLVSSDGRAVLQRPAETAGRRREGGP